MLRHVVLVVWLIAAGAVAASNVLAHEVRPAYLEIRQTGPTVYEIVWKQPAMGGVAVHLVPHLSNGWLERPATQQYAAGGFLIRSWRIDVGKTDALTGTSVAIEGLEYTITDVFVRVRLANGSSDAIIRPDSPRLAIAPPPEVHEHFALPAYLLLGIEHILTGPDHLLFVLGLVLIVRGRPMLLTTVSAFTVAHSLTLAATILGTVRLPTTFVEAVISLSIVFLAPEILRVRRGASSLTVRYPWAVAFVFGLFHGMGFAGGLTALGFESRDLFCALVLFNAGVEIGQLAFILLVLSLGRVLQSTPSGSWSPAARIPAYLVGIAGAYWTIQCSALWLGINS